MSRARRWNASLRYFLLRLKRQDNAPEGDKLNVRNCTLCSIRTRPKQHARRDSWPFARLANAGSTLQQNHQCHRLGPLETSPSPRKPWQQQLRFLRNNRHKFHRRLKKYLAQDNYSLKRKLMHKNCITNNKKTPHKNHFKCMQNQNHNTQRRLAWIIKKKSMRWAQNSHLC